MKSKSTKTQSSSNSSPYIPIFVDITQQLDENNDRQERVYKAARNVVIEAKRVVFLLHRSSQASNNATLLDEADTKLRGIVQNMRSHMTQEINQDETLFWRYQGRFSFSIQELIEAMAFLHYLKYGTLIGKNQVEQMINDGAHEDDYLQVTYDDWVLGVADLTGELMRHATNNASDRRTPFRVKQLLQEMMESFNTVRMSGKDYRSKREQMENNVRKVENLCYQIVLQAAEFRRASAPLPTTFNLQEQQQQQQQQSHISVGVESM